MWGCQELRSGEATPVLVSDRVLQADDHGTSITSSFSLSPTTTCPYTSPQLGLRLFLLPLVQPAHSFSSILR
jgi:hypothetical protein